MWRGLKLKIFAQLVFKIQVLIRGFLLYSFSQIAVINFVPLPRLVTYFS